ncbi:MAG: T9SS type A sorting domain-containing protein, partial [Croceitalea sp.]|nr:T9SS type A sorting domain-containing protein [Croceitalea sp.]
NSTVDVGAFHLYDMAGRLVKTKQVEANKQQYQMEVYDLPVGSYFIIATDAKGQQFQQQMVIKR